MVQAEIWQIAQTMTGPAVLLRPEESDRVIPIYIGPSEAQAILLGLAGKQLERPMTHDLMKRVFDELGIHVSHIMVTSITDGTFFAELHVDQGDKEYAIDSRPSDCMALAVRMKCPIYIDDDIVDSASIPISRLNMPFSKDRENGDSVLDVLKKQLLTAVDQEDYEEAATIRDRIQEIEGSD